MNILENIRSAIFNVLSNKLRTVLTTLGIIIGITSVIIITSIGKGFENQMNSEFSDMNSDVVEISTNYGETIREKDFLKMGDVESLKGHPNIQDVSPYGEINGSVKLKNPKDTEGINIAGGLPSFAKIQNLNIIHGRFYNDAENENASKVVVIDSKTAINIFGKEDVVGEKINVKIPEKNRELDLTVIGVNKISDDVYYFSGTGYLPINTLFDIYGSDAKVWSIYFKLKDINLFNSTKSEILRVLSANHNNQNKYVLYANFEILKNMSGSIKIFTLFVGLVAAISLIVGGIGVMNIMLVTVTERTREIGIRKSLGASNSNIKIQFLTEAVFISFLGGSIGVILGYVGSSVVGKVLMAMGQNLIPKVDISVVMSAFLISVLIGVIFGVYPAGKAAKLDPIEALRYE